MKRKLKLLIYLKQTGRRIRIILFALPLFIIPSLFSMAEVTIVSYIQGDNNLFEDTLSNVKSMKRVASSDKVNILVQWDQPKNKKTWRYQVKNNQLIDAGSLSTEMGFDPKQELIDMMQWVKDKFPAKKYVMILSGHGNGVIDRKNRKNDTKKPRGILYDFSQDTFLTNEGLSSALSGIKTILGQPVDVIGMDACLMAMIEIGYQIKGLANVLVASQDTEPGRGWPYYQFLTPIVNNPEGSGAREIGKYAVTAYQNYYKNTRYVTLSAVDLNMMTILKQDLDAVISRINELKTAQVTTAKSLIKFTFKNVIRFDTVDYADLNSFYDTLIQRSRSLRKTANIDFGRQLSSLEDAVTQAKTNLAQAIIANFASRDELGSLGISINYPISGVDSIYLDCTFAQESLWTNFIKGK